ncbi:hypothetical protein P691DRAFT_784145 [Macrolepiota fuliginosa MF-IS2]|uniref:Uncharacterized protein n=1 Tax=Macrolepiota fuliginosa MF-IS2 TaxID=1400762 RepID=A0A9P6C213_9AGAR|nr:hypothetical protein P691DRAFT_784145 [Macrolepiota fuliginosa MF-IS2]
MSDYQAVSKANKNKARDLYIEGQTIKSIIKLDTPTSSAGGSYLGRGLLFDKKQPRRDRVAQRVSLLHFKTKHGDLLNSIPVQRDGLQNLEIKLDTKSSPAATTLSSDAGGGISPPLTVSQEKPGDTIYAEPQVLDG